MGHLGAVTVLFPLSLSRLGTSDYHLCSTLSCSGLDSLWIFSPNRVLGHHEDFQRDGREGHGELEHNYGCVPMCAIMP
jgi:hypothetical protein